MIKNILIIISISILALACSNNSNSVSGKPTTQNVPSVDHTKKQGSLALNPSQTVLFSVSSGGATSSTSGSSTTISTITPQEDTTANSSKNEAEREYSVLTRLYNTVWFQTEEEYDHGRVETESTFLFFNENSEIEEREIETGEPNESDYSKLAIVSGINLTTSQNNDANRDKNACVVKNMEIGENDTEFELYYLKDENTLYVIELSDKKYTNPSDLESKAKGIITQIESGNAVQYNEDKYALSTI